MAMNFDPEMNPVGTTSGAAPAPQQAPTTTEYKLGDLLSERERIAAQMVALAASGNFGSELVDDGFGGLVEVASGDYKQLSALADTFDILGDLAKAGAGTAGTAGGDGGISASALAQIAQQDKQLQESIRQFDITEQRAGREFSETMGFNREQLATTVEEGARDREQRERQLKEQQRANNLSSTLDMLTNQIRTGELGVAEASNRISAATNAANVQRDILADHAGKALPAGATHYPNLGAGGPIAAMAKQLGQPFVPFETMGTFPIDPNAIAAPISASPGASMLPRVDAAVANAAAALAGMGVPQMAEGGVIPPRPGGTLVNVGEAGRPEAIIPLDKIQSMFQNRAGNGGASIPQGETPQFPMGDPSMPGAPTGMSDPLGMLKDYAENVYRPMMMERAGMGGLPNTAPMGWQDSPYWEQARQRWEQFMQQVRNRGIVPPTAQGGRLRPPQMGLQSAAQALAGM